MKRILSLVLAFLIAAVLSIPSQAQDSCTEAQLNADLGNGTIDASKVVPASQLPAPGTGKETPATGIYILPAFLLVPQTVATQTVQQIN